MIVDVLGCPSKEDIPFCLHLLLLSSLLFCVCAFWGRCCFQMIVDVLGCPSEEDMSFIQDKAARAVVLQQARQAGARRGTGGLRPLSVHFPTSTSPLALDLLAKMVSVLLAADG